MEEQLKLRAGEFVEVRSKAEILATLDTHGCLENLPFMPQMFQHCGQRFRVFKRAHKTCDTVRKPAGLKMANAVHLDGIRCDGEAYGGCQAGCLIFWKEAWLKRASQADSEPGSAPKPHEPSIAGMQTPGRCTEGDVWAGTKVADHGDENPTYVCQATQLPLATTPLSPWNIGQSIEDYRSGNVGIGRMIRGFIYALYFNVMNLGIGVGAFMRWFYDRFQALVGGVPFPRRTGGIPAGQPTPACTLNLQPGELVRVKSHKEILATLDTASKNRGLYFDAEAVPYCGGTYRVQKRVGKIIDEKTGKLVKMKNESIILEGVFCQARYSDCRLFCPRSIYSYWREIWLERVNETNSALPGRVAELTDSAGASLNQLSFHSSKTKLDKGLTGVGKEVILVGKASEAKAAKRTG